MTKFDHFDLISPLYDLVFGRRTDHRIIALLETAKDQQILDLGGGTGRVSVLVKDEVRKIVVADSSINMLREAQDKDLTTVSTYSENLPFENNCFHHVLMVDAFHHVENQQKTLYEMWRVLKQNGMIIIEEPDINNFFVKLVALGEKILFMRSHFLAPDKIVKMCAFMNGAKIKVKQEKGIAWIIIQK